MACPRTSNSSSDSLDKRGFASPRGIKAGGIFQDTWAQNPGVSGTLPQPSMDSSTLIEILIYDGTGTVDGRRVVGVKETLLAHPIQDVSVELVLPVQQALHGCQYIIWTSMSDFCSARGVDSMLLARWESQAIMGYVAEAPLATVTRDYKQKEAQDPLTHRISSLDQHISGNMGFQSFQELTLFPLHPRRLAALAYQLSSNMRRSRS